jgi:DHA2 family multidrug resistance protein-like MFS transporter
LCFGIAGKHGPTLALSLGAAFSAAASVASGLRLFAPSHRAVRH